MNAAKGWRRQEEASGPIDNAGKRLMEFALKSDIHDERLWMPIAKATGALGNTSCLVGTPEQVAEAILRYYRLGIGSFLIRGFDPMNDALGIRQRTHPAHQGRRRRDRRHEGSRIMRMFPRVRERPKPPIVAITPNLTAGASLAG